MRFVTKIFEGKRLQMILSRILKPNFMWSQHLVNNCWKTLKKWPKITFFWPQKRCFLAIFSTFFNNCWLDVDSTWNLVLESWKGSSEVSFPQISWSQTSYWLRGVEKTFFSCLHDVVGITTFIFRYFLMRDGFFRLNMSSQNYKNSYRKLRHLFWRFQILVKIRWLLVNTETTFWDIHV